MRPAAMEDAELLPMAREWQRKKAEAGYAAITWPVEWGGRGGTPIEQVIYSQEEARYAVPKSIYEVGLGMCIPTLMTYGSDEQKQRYVRPALRGEEIWCQLFSEPSAGSDLANVRTRGERRGEDWILDGQKIWTSGAHHAQFGLILARTDSSVKKHAGLTMFFLDMATPGIEVRPIRQVSGGAHFSEVFFTGVRVPDAQRLGQPGEGWKVALVTLMNERLAIGGLPGPDFDDLLTLVRRTELNGEPALNDSSVREHLASWYVESRGLQYTRYRTMTALSRGQTPGPEASIGKVLTAKRLLDVATFGVDLLGMVGAVMDRELMPMHGMFEESLLHAPSGRIAGGTDEILRNIIAERVLGMPGEIRVDRDKPFNELRSSGQA